MEAFTVHRGLVAPLDRSNVDTDQILPKQFLKRIERTGWGEYLFYNWRYDLQTGAPINGFVLNDARFAGATVLVAGSNFGSGSSREHAVWALQDHGFKVVIAASFADIFYNNCFKNGLLPVALPEETIAALLATTERQPGLTLTVDLEQCQVSGESGPIGTFQLDPFRRHCLLHGLDDIGITMQFGEKIAAYESRRHRLIGNLMGASL